MFTRARQIELYEVQKSLHAKATGITNEDFRASFLGPNPNLVDPEGMISLRLNPYSTELKIEVRAWGAKLASVQLSGVDAGKLGFLIHIHNSDITDFIEYDWSTCSVGMTPVRDLVKKMLGNIALKYRRDLVPAGCVKAYLTSDKSLWVMKRAVSDKIAKIGSDYFLVVGGCSPQFTRVYRSDTVFDWYFTNSMNTSEPITSISTGRDTQVYWYTSSTVPIYSSTIPFDSVVLYSIPETAPSMYESVIVDGELRYINIRRPNPRGALFSTPIHQYTTRIETVVSPEKLFLKGVNDLYKNRSTDVTPFLGWELEACNNLSHLDRGAVATTFKEQLPGLVFCKHDGSIQPEGFETVSVPATLDAWKESGLSEAMNVMKAEPYNMRSFKHSSCGFHVHVSRAALSVLDLQKMERFMHNPANRSFLSEIAGRGAVSYANFNDALFNDRKYSVPSSRGGHNNYTQEGVEWLIDINVAERYATPSYYTLISAWLNNCVRYTSIASKMQESFPSIMQEIRDHGHTNSPCEFLDLFRPGRSSSTPTTDALYRKIFEAIATFGPVLNRVVRHYYPEFNIPVFAEEPVAPVPAIPEWKSGMRNKAKFSTSRKDNYSVSRVFPSKVGKGEQRYDVLNTSNINTVEFRLFKGTMNPGSIFRYLEFVDALTRFVGTTSATDDGVHFTTFINWIINDSFNTSRYENLVSLLVEKKHIERAKVRRRILAELTSQDGDILKGLVVKKLADTLPPSVPLYTITATPGATIPEPNVIGFEDDNNEDDYDDNGDEIDFNDDPDICECPDCRADRGED